MGDLEDKKVELLRRLVEATEDGMEWDRYMPECFVAYWNGSRIILENLRDEPVTLWVRTGSRVIDDVLTSKTLVTATARDSEAIAKGLSDLQRAIADQYQGINEITHADIVARRRALIEETALTESAELDRLLAV